MPTASKMPDLLLIRATRENGLLAKILASWSADAGAYGDESYGAPQLEHAQDIVESRTASTYAIYVLTDADGGAHGLAHFNVALLPRTTGRTLRVVWLLLAPRYDYEDISDEKAAWLIGGFVYASVTLCTEEMKANHLKIQLPSRSDRRLGAFLAQALSRAGGATTVAVRGNWLHIDDVSPLAA